MKTNQLLRTIRKSYANYRGWSTNRKLLVFESDDWGSIRIKDKHAYDILTNKGIPLDKSRYTLYDSLEKEDDLISLYSVLKKFKDKNGNHPTFSANFLTANPDFSNISKDNFDNYHYIDLLSSYDSYSSGGQKMLSILKEGINEKIIMPQFHGREHLHPNKWLDCLKISPRERIAFEYGCIPGLSFLSNDERYVPYLSAFDYANDLERLVTHETLRSGLKLFEDFFGFKAKTFMPSQSVMGDDLLPILQAEGVEMCKAGARILPKFVNPNRKMKHDYWGFNHKCKIYYSRANCNFEPNKSSENWVDNCISDIQLAFKYGKPAVISSHRVNYIGVLNEKNRIESLIELEKLISEILYQFKDVEFADSSSLLQILKDESFQL
jgi:hypothetical protein